LQTPLSSAERLSLSAISPQKRLSELEFTFPVAGPDGQRLSSQSLARVFEVHSDGVPNRYPASLGALQFAPLTGYLRGFIDLVFEHEGRIYVVDYKSNHLGPRPGDYASERLALTMAEHHYYLQYHLYTLAVHRYFASRRRDYSYERDFGGVFYLFLRGMAPERGPQTGVFFERPPLARVSALSALFGERGTDT
jgi:exodeoxyribonuclease V beta subunit